MTFSSDIIISSTFSTTALKVTGGAQNGYVLSSDASGNTSWTASIAYDYYVARFVQTGTASPTVTTYENSIGSIVWTRLATGSYKGTLSGAFSSGKVHLLFNNPLSTRIVYFYNAADPNAIYIDCTDTTPAPADYGSDELSIEIKVYP
jgi:hypothetical protein